jgi:methionyl aminopeptidase
MRVENKNIFSTNFLCKLKGQDWLDKQRIAGKIAARTLILLENLVKEKTTKSLIELNTIAEDFITNSGGTCTFKGYKGFPAGVCMSVNKQLVHGIPTDYKLQEGDLVSFDLGVTIDGAIADTAITCIYGQPKYEQHIRLVRSTQEALMRGIESVSVGKRLGCIGAAVSKCAKVNGFGCVNQYGGHGLDWDIPHAAPFVQNISRADEGIRVQPGLTIAIEPMFTIGSTNTKVLQDGWTVVTNDIGAHAEHTIFVHEDSVEIITDRNNL